MKKIFLLLLVLGSSNCLLAQTANTTMNGNNNTTAFTATAYAALPVLETYIAPDVVAAMKNKYGEALYDITAIKKTPDQTEYVVRSLAGNEYKTEYVGSDGNALSVNNR